MRVIGRRNLLLVYIYCLDAFLLYVDLLNVDYYLAAGLALAFLPFLHEYV
jgi:hypothetical protein